MAEFDYCIVKDPGIFAQGRLAPHSDHIPMAPSDRPLSGETSLRRSLNGMWKFHYSENYVSAPKGFEQDSFDVSGWTDLSVPSNIQFEGYDAPAYVNTQYPWDGLEDIEPGQIPERFNPTGQYVRFFQVPEDWKGEEIHISFQGVESGFALWLNGSYIGYSEDSFTPSEFDLTPYLREGRNRLAVLNFKWTSGSWCEDQDMYRLSGIFRDVYLERIPALHLRDLGIQADLTGADYQDGKLDLTLDLAGETDEASVDWTLEEVGVVPSLDSLKQRGRVVLSGSLRAQGEEADQAGQTGLKSGVRLRASAALPSVMPWSAEAPNLYRLNLTLKKAGQVTETVQDLVGFRRFEMIDGIMCLNGKRVVFNGVNRHEFSCDSGRSPKIEEVVHDLTVMKQNNINAVRTCHYPDASQIYRLCDLFGLYLIAENNMETHGSMDAVERGQIPVSQALPGDRQEWEPLLLDRIRSMVALDKNHPSILIWSCGNESFGGSVIWHMAQELRRLDQTRLVHYEGIMRDMRYPDTSDLYSQMYTPVPAIEQYLADHPDKPFILCEYTHSMGNSNGAMFKYLDLARREPRYQGGFIWDFIDQAVRMKNRFGEEYFGYGGDNGERPTDYEFSGNGIVGPSRKPYSGKMQEIKFLYQNIDVQVETVSEHGPETGTGVGREPGSTLAPGRGQETGGRTSLQVRITNRSLFTSTSAYACKTILKKGDQILEAARLDTDVRPGETLVYPLPFSLPEEGETVVSVSLTLKEAALWAGEGHEVAYGEGVFGDRNPGASLESLPEGYKQDGRSYILNGMTVAPVAAKPHLEVTEGSINIGVRGDHFSALFSRLKGGMVSYRWGGRELIEKIPRPNFWRAPTNNDEGNNMEGRYGGWKLASLAQTFRSPNGNPYDPQGEDAAWPKIRKTETYVEISWKQYFPLPTYEESSSVLTTYRVFGDGTVRMILTYDPVRKLCPMPEFGWLFAFDGDLNQVTYYGMGPEENYCDRRKGSRLGVYRRETADLAEPYLVPQETGNRTGVRMAELTDHRGHGIRLTAAYYEDCGDPEASRPGTMEFSALPYSPEMLEEARHPYELPRTAATYVRCSLKQMGVGGDDSWGARTHEEFLLPTDRKLTFAVDFRGI